MWCACTAGGCSRGPGRSACRACGSGPGPCSAPARQLSRLDEAPGDGQEALSVGERPTRVLPGCVEGGGYHQPGGAGQPRLERAACAHLRLVVSLECTPQFHAGHLFGALDPPRQLLLLQVPREQPRLLVREPLLPQRRPEHRYLAQRPLQRGPLADRPLRHSQALLAVCSKSPGPSPDPQSRAPPGLRRSTPPLLPARGRVAPAPRPPGTPCRGRSFRSAPDPLATGTRQPHPRAHRAARSRADPRRRRRGRRLRPCRIVPAPSDMEPRATG
jgi:hypothetical protein